MEPQDPALFLANARDVICRFRNHPSIAVWFGRNEGVPQPIINEGLADLVATLDGTRHYTGSSNSVNLQGSGPYNYRPPEQYFTELARGFSVEVGTPSLATLESLRAMIPAADPLADQRHPTPITTGITAVTATSRASWRACRAIRRGDEPRGFRAQGADA